MAKACEEQGRVMTDEFHHTFMGMNLDGVGEMIKKEFGKDFDTEKCFARCIELNREIIKKGIPLMKGARELLDFLHQRGIKTCIGTTTERLGTTRLLKSTNMLDEFDDIVCGDEIENGKPAPDIYLECFRKFNVDKSEVLIFEDGQAGAEAAIASGMRLVLVPDLALLDDEVKSKAFKVISSLDKIIDVIKEENERTASI